MSLVLTTTAVIVALAAALRSTWSPCGWSMLSTITPLTERARRHRFGATATWFLVGAVVGGLLLGAVGAAAATGVSALELDLATRCTLAVVAMLLAAVLDGASTTTATFRGALPHHRRQVNEQWLDEFRPWVYASGFGLQIGAGLATYIMTGGVYLVVVVGALTAHPALALVLGVVFGTARGAAVWVGAGNDGPQQLAAFHRRFAALSEPVRRAVAVTYALVALALTGAVADLAPAGLSVAMAIVFTAVVVANAFRQPAAVTVTPASAPLITPASAVRRVDEPTTA